MNKPLTDQGRNGGARQGPDVLDLVGLALFTIAIAWTVAAATRWEANPWPMILSFGVAALGVAVGRLLGGPNPMMIPAIVLGIAAVVLLLDPADTLTGRAHGGPLGYSNAAGALFVQGAVSALMLMVLARRRATRVLTALGAAGFVVVPAATGSLGAAGSALLLPVAAVVALRGRPLRLAILGCATALGVAIGLSTWLAIGANDTRGGQLTSSLTRVLGDRVDLWSEAVEIVRAHPIGGVGPGRFEEESFTARSDPDLHWVHHEFLQQAAETGIVGAAVLISTFVWGFGRLGSAPSPIGVLGAAGLAALGIHANIDYILHFPVLPLATGALVGFASRTSAELRSQELGK